LLAVVVLLTELNRKAFGKKKAAIGRL